MTPSDLKYNVEQTGSYFFTRDTMRFFGDRMSNYGVRSKPVTIDTYSEKNVKCWELYRRKPVRYNNQKSAYFRVDNFARAFPKKG